MPTHHEPGIPLHRVYVDGENVPLPDEAFISNRSIFLTLFLGARNTRMETSLVEALMKESKSVKLVRLKVTGRNALDGVLACYVGQGVITHPKAHFHIISKDKGFDALVNHLRSEEIRIQRHDGYENLPGESRGEKSNSADLSTAALERLKSSHRIRPGKQKTLQNFLRSNFGSGVSQEDAMAVIDRLKTTGKISVSETGAVSYHLDGTPAEDGVGQ